MDRRLAATPPPYEPTVRKHRRSSIAIRISLYFFIAGSLWVVFSDIVVSRLSTYLPFITAMQISKGMLFVTVMSALIYGMLHRWEKKLEAAAEREARTTHAMTDAISAMLSLRDPFTSRHTNRAVDLAVRLGRTLALSEPAMHDLVLGAKLHDIGNIGFPSDIINKPATLSTPEMNLIQTHSLSGYQLLKNAGVPSPIPEIVLQHHERLDGSGYPHRLERDAIIPEARILAVADVVTAMASHRPYRPAHDIASILEELRRFRDIKYDAGVVDACIGLLADPELVLVDA